METEFDYKLDYSDAEMKYSCKLDKWLFDTFVNTSTAPTNNRPWFNARICSTLDKVGKGEPIVIGLTGRAGSGKDSAIGYLFGSEGSPYRIRTEQVSFARPLKTIARIFGFTSEQLTNRELKETTDEFWGISPRQFLQMCGTEMFRNVWRDDVWVKLAQKCIKDLSETEYEVELQFGSNAKTGKLRLIFVTDVRFPNEAKMIKDIGGYMVRINRPNNPNNISCQHDSERFVDELPVDLTVTNDCVGSDEWSWKFSKELIQFFDKTAFHC